MAKISSQYWNEHTGACEKHHLPHVPCPQCLDEHDSDVEVRLTETDRVVLDFDPDLSVRDLLPTKSADWLLERVIA